MRYILAPVIAGFALMQMVPADAADAASLGTPMPGAHVSRDHDFKAECGFRYRFTTSAGVDAIVGYYNAQARANGLTLVKDTRDQFPYTRMLGFDEKGGSRLLFVEIERKVDGNAATVTFRTSKAPASCK